ncbi:MAG: hypothetical protein JNM79_09840 [Burkholderiales bacterium]|nr:hypothetical protein [Burkholderiales bacterium]
MARQVLIVHGWSDNSDSFKPLAEFLKAAGFDAKLLWLGDYISMDDDVRVDDVGMRMGEVIKAMQAQGKLNASFDMIVHSTGALVARSWLTTWYRGQADKAPLKRLIMLAPANHGSKLAAVGKSMLGRIVKGYGNWFQTGQSMLNDLELSSPFQWELAQRDLLVPPGGTTGHTYGEHAVWPFVIVGTHPYAGMLRKIVNEDGGDGTVRVCAANLPARGVTIDFGRGDTEAEMRVWDARMDFDIPLAVLPTRTHASVIDPERAAEDNQEDIAETAEEKAVLGQCILEALNCATFARYQQISTQWNTLSEATADRRLQNPESDQSAFYHQYLQVNTYVVDDHGKPVNDYFLEFYSSADAQHDEANSFLHSQVIRAVKNNAVNPALRNLYFDRTQLVDGYYKRLPAGTSPVLYMSISAAAPGKNINYFDPDTNKAKRFVMVHLEDDPTRRWLKRNATHYVQIVIPRRQVEGVFRLKRFG